MAFYSQVVVMRPATLLVLLLVGSISMARLPQPCAAQGKMVFAHYMLYSFLYTDDVAGFTREIALAKQYGIDGFALNTGVWNDIYQTRADYLYQAADAAGGDFKLFFSADLSGSLTLDNIRTMLTRYAAYSSQLTYNGKQFISTFAGRTVSISPYTAPLSTWRDGIFTPAGGSYFFVPFFETSGAESDISSVINQFDSILSGLLAWDTSAWPYVNGVVSDAADKAYISACSAAGKIYMASVSPWFYRPDFDIKGNYAGDTLWRTHWQQLIDLNPDLIEILTWNDWAERTYVVPIPSDTAAGVPYGVSDNNDADYPHLAYLDLAGRYFIPWYKTGQKPAIDSASKEAIYIYYYKQSKTGSSVGNSGVLDDKVYVTVLLYEPADVIITSGTQSTTISVPAGLQSVSMAFSTGQQSASVVRSGATILSVTGDLAIVPTGSTYDFNVYANYKTAS